MGCWIILILGMLMSLASDGLAQPAAVDRVPANPNATGEVRRTLELLAALSEDRRDGILLGQNVGHANLNLKEQSQQWWLALTNRGLAQPAIMSLDYGYDRLPRHFRRATRILTEHHRAGGLITISMHPPNPWTGGGCKELSSGGLEQLRQSESMAARRWRFVLERVADGLEQLHQNGVVVLWRPLHEMNGDWFWWSAGNPEASFTAAEYQWLWRDMYKYFTQQRGLHNLLWVYSPSINAASEPRSLGSCYPGDDYVDVVAPDFYTNDIGGLSNRGLYEQLCAFGKPLALGEYGAEPMDGKFEMMDWVKTLETEYPRFAYVVFWHSWGSQKVALVDLESAPAALRLPYVRTLDDLRSMRQ